MSKTARNFSILGAVVCGVLGGWATWQPEFEAQRAQRLGETPSTRTQDERALSKAIMSDLQEAKQQVTNVEKGGFAWGIRQAIWGKAEDVQPHALASHGQDSETRNSG